MPLDLQAIRTCPQHLAAVDAMRREFDEPEGVDVSTDDDLEARDVRLQRTDGTVLIGSYNKHAEMFAVFVAKGMVGNTGAWLGAIDAPWSENLDRCEDA
jgi:hypothetical protein